MRVHDYELLRVRAIALNNPRMHQALPDPLDNLNPHWPALYSDTVDERRRLDVEEMTLGGIVCYASQGESVNNMTWSLLRYGSWCFAFGGDSSAVQHRAVGATALRHGPFSQE